LCEYLNGVLYPEELCFMNRVIITLNDIVTSTTVTYSATVCAHSGNN